MLEVGNIEYFRFTNTLANNKNYKMSSENSTTKWIDIRTNRTVAELRFTEQGSKFYILEDVIV